MARVNTPRDSKVDSRLLGGEGKGNTNLNLIAPGEELANGGGESLIMTKRREERDNQDWRFITITDYLCLFTVYQGQCTDDQVLGLVLVWSGLF